MEELRLEIKNVIEKETSELNFEEIIKDSDRCIEFIKANYTYNKSLTLKKDNIYDILFFLEIYKKTELNKKISNIDNEYLEYKNKYISKIKNLNSINYDLFYYLISDKAFYKEIISILKSKTIADYLNKKRYYDEINEKNKNFNIYDFKFANEGEPYIEYLSEEYKKLMDNFKDNKFFVNIFRLKYLPFGIKAFINYNLKIIINSLYYEFNENINENNKIIIFRAALKIIIIHEIMHVLKYLKKNENFKEMPSTPREREAGKMLINYLFGTPTIKRIDLEEAKKINVIKYWNDINLLKTIFHEKKESFEKSESYNKNICHINLYFNEEDNEDENIKKDENNEDIGIDID